MMLTYDPRHNIACIRLREKRADGELDTIHLSDQLNIDMAPDGTIYGIELLNANEQLHAQDGGMLVVANAAGASVSKSRSRRNIPAIPGRLHTCQPTIAEEQR